MNKKYKGYSNIFKLSVENRPFPEGYEDQPDQDAVLELIKDLGGHMSVKSKVDTIKWCLDKINQHDEIADNRTNHLKKSIQEIEYYIKYNNYG